MHIDIVGDGGCECWCVGACKIRMRGLCGGTGGGRSGGESRRGETPVPRGVFGGRDGV